MQARPEALRLKKALRIIILCVYLIITTRPCDGCHRRRASCFRRPHAALALIPRASVAELTRGPTLPVAQAFKSATSYTGKRPE
jgi:hypothetical protein